MTSASEKHSLLKEGVAATQVIRVDAPGVEIAQLCDELVAPHRLHKADERCHLCTELAHEHPPTDIFTSAKSFRTVQQNIACHRIAIECVTHENTKFNVILRTCMETT